MEKVFHVTWLEFEPDNRLVLRIKSPPRIERGYLYAFIQGNLYVVTRNQIHGAAPYTKFETFKLGEEGFTEVRVGNVSIDYHYAMLHGRVRFVRCNDTMDQGPRGRPCSHCDDKKEARG